MGFRRVGSCEEKNQSHQSSNAPVMCLLIVVFSHSHREIYALHPFSPCILEKLNFSNSVVGVGGVINNNSSSASGNWNNSRET